MDSDAKFEVLQERVNPKEEITVDFLDEIAVSAVITECTVEHVGLLMETRLFPLRQYLCVPMSKIVLDEDQAHNARVPEKPPRVGRLRLLIRQNCPRWI